MQKSRHFLRIIPIVCCTFLSFSVFASSNPEGIQVYQKNMHLSEEHKQKLANDIERFRTADNMWDVLRQEFILPHYEDNPLVKDQIKWFLNHQSFLQHCAERAAPYLYYILQQVRIRHLPAELVLLPMMESAYNPFAYSSAGAAGIWQMMPGTASGYGIKQNWWYDGRRDVVASTKAALDYLAYLGSFFEGNWLLAIAAYDTGEGNVLSAIRRNYQVGASTEFWALPVAQETRYYVPRLLALATIISHPYEYPINFPAVHNAPYLAQVDIGKQIDLKHAAYLAGLSLTSIKQLNPGFNHAMTAPTGPHKLVLPIENVQQFAENFSRTPYQEKINWVHYTTKRGDTIKTIAQRFNTTPSALRKANPKLVFGVKPGKNLMIPNSTPTLSEAMLEPEQENPTVSEAPPERTVSFSAKIGQDLAKLKYHYTMQPGDTLYMVRTGDTLQKIANHFHIPADTLIAINGNASMQAGNQLIIPTHQTEQTGEKYEISAGDTVYMVRKGDTIEKIADKFHITPANIRITNLLASNNVEEGDRLVIPTHG